MLQLNKKCLLTFVFGFSLSSAPAFAVQEFEVADGDTVSIRISAKELTRVKVAGAGRIDNVFGVTGDLEIQPDKEKGEIFLRPTTDARAALSFFVRDDSGSTYTLIAVQSDVPSETVVLIPKTPHFEKVDHTAFKAQPFVEKIKKLVKAMALDQPLDGYRLASRTQPVPFWKESNIVLQRVYLGTELVGSVYSMTNISEQSLTLHESEFFQFGEQVQAIALEKLQLAPGESGSLFVVRRTGAARGRQ